MYDEAIEVNVSQLSFFFFFKYLVPEDPNTSDCNSSLVGMFKKIRF